ncbi:hypothetical protein [Salinirussus salinus]|jgi:alkaline phosphatase D|uniref:hypothetical protein n=1 Tax=Salinirussus salinus TaxID=1198300 RepID=UPI00135861CC|nr:hypothetical protein [Salinirussus salinus]
MSRGAGVDGRDEPARDGDDHAELLSTLDSHDLALGMDLVEASESGAFEFEPDADPAEAFPQSVASGGPTPTGVILWTRVHLEGRLAPDSEYHCRFSYDGVPSRPGRYRTFPRPDDHADSVRFDVLTCQNDLKQPRNSQIPTMTSSSVTSKWSNQGQRSCVATGKNT